MKNIKSSNLAANAPNMGDALGLGTDSFGAFIVERDQALAIRQEEHEHLMCEALQEALAWAD